MAELALALWLLYGLAAAARVAAHRRRTGTTGFARASAAPTRLARLAERAHWIAIAAGAAAPVLDLAGVIDPIAALERDGLHAAGVALFAAGLAGMVVSQAAMGDSWRVGTDPSERTLLVTHGPFALVRNPIYTSLFLAFCGLALVVPNAAALVSVLLWSWAVEVETRRVEEPNLKRLHGARWEAYAARVGRFAPGIGRIRPRHPSERQFV